MADDPGSLSNLHDLALLPPISFWPPAPGILILAAGLIAAGVIFAWHARRRYRADAYRRAALAELAAEPAPTPEEISAILKRTALCAFPRDEVASLTGKAWVAFLAETGGADFDPAPFASLAEDAFRATPAAAPGCLGEARRWVRQHRPVAETEAA